MLSFRQKIIILVVIILLGGIAYFLFSSKETGVPIAKNNIAANENKLEFISGDIQSVTDGEKIKIRLGEKIYTAEIARTPEARSRGLSGRDLLAADEALLFVFDEADNYGFWMKDMKFAIDIIWLNENFEVVDITKNATPDSYPQIFKPKSPAQYVLEIGRTN